jgi:hypothetical protein
MNDDYEVVMSPLSTAHESEGKAVQIEIYKDGEGCWILEVEDDFGNSTVWDDHFTTDQAALREALDAIKKDGIDSLIGPPPGGCP